MQLGVSNCSSELPVVEEIPGMFRVTKESFEDGVALQYVISVSVLKQRSQDLDNIVIKDVSRQWSRWLL